MFIPQCYIWCSMRYEKTGLVHGVYLVNCDLESEELLLPLDLHSIHGLIAIQLLKYANEECKYA